MTKFKIGDKVRVTVSIPEESKGDPIGRIGTIVESGFSWDHRVRFDDGGVCPLDEDELELVEDDSPDFKVGDRVLYAGYGDIVYVVEYAYDADSGMPHPYSLYREDIPAMKMWANGNDLTLTTGAKVFKYTDIRPGDATIPGSDPVEHPAHYTAYGAEVIEITEHLNFCRGNAVKYITRAGLKDPDKEIEDLEKAAWYLNREINRLKAVTLD